MRFLTAGDDHLIAPLVQRLCQPFADARSTAIVTEPISLSGVFVRVDQTSRGHGGDVVAVHPAEAGMTHKVSDLRPPALQVGLIPVRKCRVKCKFRIECQFLTSSHTLTARTYEQEGGDGTIVGFTRIEVSRWQHRPVQAALTITLIHELNKIEQHLSAP